MFRDHLSTYDNMSVPSIPHYENVNGKICDADCQKDFSRLPRIYSRKCFSGSSSEERPSENSEIYWTAIQLNKSAQTLEMNVGANHEQIPSTEWSQSYHLKSHQLIPTNCKVGINENVKHLDPQTWNLNPATCTKSEPVIFPRQASCAFFPAQRTTPPSLVVISLELLDSLRGLSLPLAASTVGVSATAFKKACRRLGVTRWEYRRGPGRASSKNVAGPTGPVSTSRPRSVGRASRPSRTAGEVVDMQLAGVPGVGTAVWETKELADWLRGEVTEMGRAVMAEPEDDALVLQMLALRWPVTAAVTALD